VIITAVIAVPVGSTASGITNALTTTLGSTSAATSFLGIDVESSPTFTTTDNNRDRDTGNSLALPLGLGLGLGLGGCLVLSALFVLIKRRKGKVPIKRSKGKVPVSSTRTPQFGLGVDQTNLHNRQAVMRPPIKV
jgi:hypothetical protein